jgi:hypothetical protein
MEAMKNIGKRTKTIFIAVFILTILACGLPGTSLITPTSAPLASSLPQELPTGNPIQTIEISTESSIVPVNLPVDRAGFAADMDSSSNAESQKVSGGDRFSRGLLERPFNAVSMDTYFPDIDIIETEGFINDLWGVATITLAGLDEEGKLSGNYAVELDLDRNGRGEWLIIATNPSDTSWTTEGVRMYKDANGDIGSITPLFADPPAFGDGYETLVFDKDKGEPSDAVIVRIAPSDARKINIAFQLSIVGNPNSFIMGVWAGNYLLSPALFDFNDNFTHEQAGSPIADFYVYPLKSLSEIDNTCRLAINFFPSGAEPGLCTSASAPSAGGGDGCTLTVDYCEEQQGSNTLNPGHWEVIYHSPSGNPSMPCYCSYITN